MKLAAQVLLALACAAAMTSKEACAELQLSRHHSEKELKSAYRKRSVETHPDKGGSTEKFLRVSEAYELLSQLASGSGGPGQGRPRPSSFGEGATQEEMMRRAEEMFDSVLDELMQRFDSAGIDGVVDDLLGQAKGPFKWVLKRVLKSGARALASGFGQLMESDGMTIEINGQAMSGREFKEWREHRKRGASAIPRRNHQQRTTGGHEDL